MKLRNLIYPLIPIGAIACLAGCSVPGWHHSIPSPTTTPTATKTTTQQHPKVHPQPKPVKPGVLMSVFRTDGLSPVIKVDAQGTPYIVADLDGTKWTCYPGKGFTLDAQGGIRLDGWTCSTASVSPADVLGFAALTGSKIVRG
jgi:hypothetical protein